jgi:transposase InsO family protein
MKNQCGRPIKCLRYDNGREYVNRPFEEYLAQYGISWQRFVPHTPQQNDVAERKNWTLVEMARCLLQAKDLRLSFGLKLFIVPTIS